VFAQVAASSSPDSPMSKTVGGAVSSKQIRLPSAKRRPTQFTQNQFYSTPFDKAYEELAKARNLRKLELLFYEADTDGSGDMSLHEFREGLRCTRLQRAFAALGVQLHQSELVFRSLDKRGTGELTITEFMQGLTELVGTDVDGTGKELDIETLRPAYRSRQRSLSVCQKPSALSRSTSAPRLIHDEPKHNSNLDLGPVHLLPKVKVQRAFVHSASAQALHCAAATRQPLKLIFPF